MKQSMCYLSPQCLLYIKRNDVEIHSSFRTFVLNAYSHDICRISKYKLLINPLLVDADVQYPNFLSWYAKVSSELYVGLRSIVFILHKEDVAAFSILKHTVTENKICTFFTSPRYRNNGVGSLLMRISLGMFDGKSVALTMPERKVEEFDKILKKNNFIKEKSVMNYNNRNEEEFFFRCSDYS